MSAQSHAVKVERVSGSPIPGFAAGLLIVIGLSILAWWITQQVYGLNLPLGIPGKALEFPLWAALVGLAGNAVLKILGAHSFVRPGFRTELFIKIGLVLLGAGVSFATLVTAAG